MNIHVPKPERTEYSAQQFAIEMSFDALLTRGNQAGLRLNPCFGLMYLPEQKLAKDFIDACRAILAALEMKDDKGGPPTTPALRR